MMRFEYDDRDYVRGQLTTLHRTDLSMFVPQGDASISSVDRLFWRDAIARFRRGEVWDAVTAIERRYRPKHHPFTEDNNAYHFVEPVR